jgi:peptidoglycan hydrolase CwlO-like protein
LLDKKEKVKKELEKILKLLLLEENDDSLKFLNDRKLENENIIKNIMQLIKEKRDEVNKLENEESDKKDIIEFYNKLK